MEILTSFLQYLHLLFNSVFLLYFGLTAIYLLVFALASKFYKEKKTTQQKARKYRVSVLLPAYKEDSVIIESASEALKHKSLSADLQVVVIADSLQTSTIEKMQKLGAIVLPVLFDKSTKAKSLNVALSFLPSDTDYVVILDADNIMQLGFIDKIIGVIDQGFRIVQGHRMAKNSNTQFAVLDGISEEINNSIFRKGHRVLGLSSALIGSGIISEFGLMKSLMAQITAIGGFDKELETMLLERKITIGYAENAMVLDEKIQQADAFVNQRRRWLSAQFIFFNKNFKKAIRQLFTSANFDLFDKISQFILPPRIISLGLTFMFAIMYAALCLLFPSPLINILAIVWVIVFLVLLLSAIIAIPSKMFNIRLLKSLLTIPYGFILMMKALLKLKGADKKFIHTKHGINS
jgi:cellulose synthase/poly-beta-1,6-N-acetylglucosamine synthase-like glycosyltransferase